MLASIWLSLQDCGEEEEDLFLAKEHSAMFRMLKAKWSL